MATSAITLTEDSGRGTIAEDVQRRIMLDIVGGELEPGFRLRVEKLKQRYGVGGSPLREALSALTAAGFVTLESHRGFRVPELSREDIEDITRLRGLVEVEALALAMARGDVNWESNIVAAFHRYTMYAARLGENSAELPLNIEREHRAFHTALIAACGSPRLIELQASLYDQALRYRLAHRNWRVEVMQWIAEHENLMKIVLSRDVEKARTHILSHLQATPRDLYGEPAES